MTPAGLLHHLRAQSSIIGAMALKFVAAGLSFVITFVIARLYGAEASGQYALFSFTVITFGAIAVFGNDHLLVRRMSGLAAVGKLDLARLSYSHAIRWACTIGLTFALAVFVIAMLFGREAGISWQMAAAVAVGIVLQSLFMIANAAVRATHRLVQSQFLQAIQPAAIVAMLAWSASLALSEPGPMLMLGFLAGLAIATGCSLIFVRRLIGSWPRSSRQDPDEGRSTPTKLGLTSALDFATLWAALSLTGLLMTVADAGVFRVCLQFINVVAIIGTTLDGLMGPRLASQFARGDIAASRRTLNRSAMFLALIGGVPLAMIAVFSEEFLGLMGPEFRVGASTLRVLAVGQLGVLLAGAAGTALNMNGREDISLRLSIVSFILVVPLMAVLTYQFGLDGAAMGLAVMWLIRYQGSNLFARRMLSKALRDPRA